MPSDGVCGEVDTHEITEHVGEEWREDGACNGGHTEISITILFTMRRGGGRRGGIGHEKESERTCSKKEIRSEPPKQRRIPELKDCFPTHQLGPVVRRG